MSDTDPTGPDRGPRLEGTGIWAAQLRYGDPGQIREAASELDGLGFSALWIPDIGGDLFTAVETLLSATTRTTVATGILNLWMHEAAETASQYARLAAAHGGRLLFGIGVSHAPLVDAGSPGRYTRPLAAMSAYLDELDAAEPPLARADRVLAALGPRMLDMARDRAAGAHPYNVTVEHTSAAREALGPGPLLLPEQAVALTTDAERARTLGRGHLAPYLQLPNYANNLLRHGFGPDDLEGGGSDRLVDALVAWGPTDRVVSRLQEHRDAGADHVCVQVVSDSAMPLAEWRELAAALG